MTGGCNGWQDDNGEWRFSITILPEGNRPGQMIFGLKPKNGSEPETKGLPNPSSAKSWPKDTANQPPRSREPCKPPKVTAEVV